MRYVRSPGPCNEIHNSGSLVTDHNGYLRNRDQFLSQLLNNLVVAAYGRQKDQNQPFLVCPEDLKQVSTRRRWQITYLVIARMITIGFGLALFFFYHLSAVDTQMSSLVHAVPPHRDSSKSVLRCVTGRGVRKTAH